MPRKNLLSLLYLLVLAAGAGSLALFPSRYNEGAERVMDELPLESEATVWDGVIYYAESNRTNLEFTDDPPPPRRIAFYRAEPGIGGATVRLLGTVTPKGDAPLLTQADQLLEVREAAILWVERQDKPSPPRPAFGGGGFAGGASSRSAPRFLGEFVAPTTPVAPKPGERRDVTDLRALFQPTRSEYLLWRIPTQGGAPISVPLKAETDAMTLTFPSGADAVYWLNDPVGSLINVNAKTQYWNERPRSASLMSAPLSGGPAQRIASGIATNRGVVYNEQVAGYVALQPYPNSNPTLHLRRTRPGSDATEIVFPDYHGPSAPYDYANRWFWVEPEPPQSLDAGRSLANEPVERSQIVTAQAGGAGRRVLVPPHNDRNEGRRCDRLFVHKNQLYLLYTAKNPQLTPAQLADVKINALRSFLVRLDPEHGITGEPTMLPDLMRLKGICDGDYFYFAGTHDVITWRGRMDIFFAERGASTRQQRSLYRVPLPK